MMAVELEQDGILPDWHGAMDASRGDCCKDEALCQMLPEDRGDVG